MSYLFYDALEEGDAKYAQYNLYSELPFDTKILPLIEFVFQFEDVQDIEYRYYVIDNIRINYLRFVLCQPFNPGTEVFSNVFMEQFLKDYLPESRNIDRTPIRSGSCIASQLISSASADRIARLHYKCMEYRRNLARCGIDFEKSGHKRTREEFLRLAEQYDLSGGSWLIHTRNYKLEESGQPRRVWISPDRVRKMSISSFMNMLELVQNGMIAQEFFKAARWIRFKEEQGYSYVTRIINSKSNYLSNFLIDGEAKSDLWYFNEDKQVCHIYRLLEKTCVNRPYQSCSYKAEVVSACNLNRRSLTNDIMLCFYPSLRPLTMKITDLEDLEDAYTNSDQNTIRFGDKKNFPRRNFGDKKNFPRRNFAENR